LLLQLLTVLAEKPPASAGYRGSDLVPWRKDDIPAAWANSRLPPFAEEFGSEFSMTGVDPRKTFMQSATVDHGWIAEGDMAASGHREGGQPASSSSSLRRRA
jgi:hypothetical protein